MTLARPLIILLLALTLLGCGSRQAAPTVVPAAVTAEPIPTATPVPAPDAMTTAALTPTATTEAAAFPTPEPAPTPPFPPTIALQPLIDLSTPIVYLTHAGDGSNRIFVVEKTGRVRIIAAGEVLATPFLDISALVNDRGSEQGLLSIAFDPNFAQNGEFYVNYTDRAGDGDTVIARYRVSPDPNLADPASGQIILTIDQPADNHNGGQLQFGPDGYLYIGTGDGGAAGDPWGNGQNVNALLGKLLRLDVSGQKTYAIPADNPFANNAAAAPEIWAYGLRNPWRFSFDRATGDLIIADVGQGAWEEVNFQSAASAGGENYGWNTMEGSHCFQPNRGCDTDRRVMPVFEYDHSQGCSITGGYVYRGAAFPALAGTYLFGDYCSGRIWGLRADGAGNWQSALLLESQRNIASFGEDESGELYVLDLGGRIYRVSGM